MSSSGALALRTLAWCTGVLLAGAALLTAVVVGVGALMGPDPAYSGPPADTAGQEFARLAATDPATALRSCTEARGTDFDALAGALREGTLSRERRYAVVEGPLTFLAAPVTGAGTAGDDAVWAWGGQGFAAVSTDARTLSPDLPGPQAYGVTADAPGAVRAAACVEAARRVGEPGVRPAMGPTAPTGTAGD
ncbi:hypothetical protein ACLFMI_12380 [Pseudonocardia nantongensis]|uniref:hypothetical protein n=1 Tax=Pseudonocardia nantongensis TaxID=1181885 RepID=UPI00397BEC8F